MIFKHDDPIDDNLLHLAKRFKDLVKGKIEAKWVKDRDVWVLESKDYLSDPVCVSYHWIDKNKYEVFIRHGEEESRTVGSFRTTKDAVEAINLLKMMEAGLSNEAVEYLANTARNPYVTLTEAANKMVKETEIIITFEQMRLLGIDENMRGTVAAKKFGI